MIPALLTFANSTAGRVIGAVLAVILILGGDYALGHHNGVADEKRAEAARLDKAKKKVSAVETKSATITDTTAGKLQATTADIQTRTRILIQKVPVYVTAEDDRRCVVPDGAVGLLNAAAGLPDVPQGPGRPDQATAAVPLSAIVATGVENLGLGNQWRAEALTWRDWYVQQATLWAKDVKAAP